MVNRVYQMSNPKRIFIIVVVFIVFYLVFAFAPYFSQVVYDLKHPDGGNFKIPAEEEITQSYEININYAPVPESSRNLKIDCANSKDIPGEHRRSKNLCVNIYQTGADDLKNKITNLDPERIILYGQFAVINYPTKTAAQIENYLEQAHITARFIDNYLYPKFAEAAGIKIPAKKLYIHLSGNKDELQKYCSQKASACAKDNVIYLLIHGKSKGLYFPSGLDRSAKMGYKAGQNEESIYWYYEIQPPNCPMLSKFAHEFTHYFDNLSYGVAETWLEEGVARIFELAVYKEMCPPGVKAFDVRREENGISYPVENFEYPSDEAMRFFLTDFWNGDNCRLAQFLLINRELKTQGLKFHQKMSMAFKNKSEKEKIMGLINVSSDPAGNKNIFQNAGCFKAE